MSLKITTLIENNSDENNILLSEHGLSLYIEIDEKVDVIITGNPGLNAFKLIDVAHVKAYKCEIK